MKRRRIVWIARRITALCLCLVLTGCSGGGADYALGTTEYGFGPQGGEAEVSYEVPAARPNVLTDCFGYEPGSEKTVIFHGKELPDTFTLRDAKTREVVYTGKVKKKSTDGDTLGEFDSYGEFSDFRKPGDYYIQVDRYGESYPFIIHDNLYYSLYLRAFEKLHGMRSTETGGGGWQMQETGAEKEISACLSICQLLFSYEMFPEVYTDDTDISESGNGIPDVLDECRYEVEWLIDQAAQEEETDGIVCGYRAATLAKYAYLTKSFDTAFAGECLKAAETAWKNANKDLSVSDGLIAFAAAELYRVTGGRQYLGLAEEYLGNSVAKEEKLSDPEFFGGVTYMNTKSKVDVELCDAIIRKIMEEAEEIAEVSKQNSFLVYGETERVDRREILQQMMRICIVNHVITNHEYNIVIENHFHYLMGRNPDSVCHVSYWEGQEMQTDDIMKNPVENTAFLFMMSELLSNG